MELEADTCVFMERLVSSQAELFCFISSLLPGLPHDVSDVVQETNRALITHAGDYDPTRPFLPWMLTFAKNQVRAFRKRRKIDRLVFDDELVARCERAFVERSASAAEAPSVAKRLALCLQRLTERQRRLVAWRYHDELPMDRIARKMGICNPTARSLLFYVRKKLADCMERLCRDGVEDDGEAGELSGFEERVSDVLEGGATPEGVGCLLSELSGSDERLDLYLDQMRVHALLSKDCLPGICGGLQPRAAAVPFVWRPGVLWAAATIAVSAVGILLGYRCLIDAGGEGNKREPSQTAGIIASAMRSPSVETAPQRPDEDGVFLKTKQKPQKAALVLVETHRDVERDRETPKALKATIKTEQNKTAGRKEKKQEVVMNGMTNTVLAALRKSAAVAVTGVALSGAQAATTWKVSLPVNTINEGPAGTTTSMVFRVTLSASVAETASVSFSTQDGTAVAGVNYLATNGVVTLAPGETVADLPVTILGSNANTGNKTVLMVLSAPDPVTYTIATASVTGTITGFTAPKWSVASDQTLTEGWAGTNLTMNFTLTLDKASTVPVSVEYMTEAVTALADQEYVTVSGRVDCPAGMVTNVLVPVTILGNNVLDGSRTFLMRITNTVESALGTAVRTGTINDKSTFTVASPSVIEGGNGTVTNLSFALSLTSTQTDRPVTVYYETTNGTALAEEDYLAASGTVTFAVGQTATTVTVAVVGNDAYQANRILKLRAYTEPRRIFLKEGTGTITDDDAAPARTGLRPGEVLHAAIFSAPTVGANAGNPSSDGQGWYSADCTTLLNYYTDPVRWANSVDAGVYPASLDYRVVQWDTTVPTALYKSDSNSKKGAAWIYAPLYAGKYKIAFDQLYSYPNGGGNPQTWKFVFWNGSAWQDLTAYQDFPLTGAKSGGYCAGTNFVLRLSVGEKLGFVVKTGGSAYNGGSCRIEGLEIGRLFGDGTVISLF